MATATVSCSLSTSSSVIWSVGSRKVTGRSSLAWNPLPKSAMLRSSSSHLCSSASVSFGHEDTLRLPRHRLANQKGTCFTPRAGKDDLETEQLSEIEKIDEDYPSLPKSFSESAKNVLGNAFASAAKPAVVAAMMALLLAQPTEDAFAASGGRMGGKAFSAPRSAPSRSYSGGGGGGGGGARSYSGGGGYSGGGYAAPPIYGGGYGGFSPFGYSPFYGGGYGGSGLMLGPPIGFGGIGPILLGVIAFGTLRSIVGLLRNRFGAEDEEDDRFDD